MRYVGGKVRQAKAIAEVINARRGGRTRYLEPFVGGASVLSAVAPSFEKAEAGDVVPDLVMFWNAVSRGWCPPSKITSAEYIQLKASSPSALRAWAGFAASYNGKWWGGYGPTAAGRDYLSESYRSTMRKATGLRNVVFDHKSYTDWMVDANTVVYCDPPYFDTMDYGAVGIFDHSLFWRTMDLWTDIGALVLVSEYSAPKGWMPLLSWGRVETMNHGGPSSGKRTEHLFGRECDKHLTGEMDDGGT